MLEVENFQASVGWLNRFRQRYGVLFKYFQILLLIDNCTPHNAPLKLDNICVEYFPPNSTAVLQPLDQGIIRAVKSRYIPFCYVKLYAIWRKISKENAM